MNNKTIENLPKLFLFKEQEHQTLLTQLKENKLKYEKQLCKLYENKIELQHIKDFNTSTKIDMLLYEFILIYIQNENLLRGDIAMNVYIQTVEIVAESNQESKKLLINPIVLTNLDNWYDKAYIQEKHNKIIFNVKLSDNWFLFIINPQQKVGLMQFPAAIQQKVIQGIEKIIQPHFQQMFQIDYNTLNLLKIANKSSNRSDITNLMLIYKIILGCDYEVAKNFNIESQFAKNSFEWLLLKIISDEQNVKKNDIQTSNNKELKEQQLQTDQELDNKQKQQNQIKVDINIQTEIQQDYSAIKINDNEKDKEIEQLKQQISQLIQNKEPTNESVNKKQTIDELSQTDDNDLAKYQIQLEYKDKEIVELKDQLKQNEKKINENNQPEVNKQQNNIQSFCLSEQNHNEKTQKQLQQKEQEILQLQQKIDQQLKQIQEFNKQKNIQTAQESSNQSVVIDQIKEKDKEILQLKQNLSELEKNFNNIQKTQQNTIDQQEKQIQLLNQQKSNQSSQESPNQSVGKDVVQLQNQLQEKDKEIQQLKQKLNESQKNVNLLKAQKNALENSDKKQVNQKNDQPSQTDSYQQIINLALNDKNNEIKQLQEKFQQLQQANNQLKQQQQAANKQDPNQPINEGLSPKKSIQNSEANKNSNANQQQAQQQNNTNQQQKQQQQPQKGSQLQQDKKVKQINIIDQSTQTDEQNTIVVKQIQDQTEDSKEMSIKTPRKSIIKHPDQGQGDGSVKKITKKVVVRLPSNSNIQQDQESLNQQQQEVNQQHDQSSQVINSQIKIAQMGQNVRTPDQLIRDSKIIQTLLTMQEIFNLEKNMVESKFYQYRNTKYNQVLNTEEPKIDMLKSTRSMSSITNFIKSEASESVALSDNVYLQQLKMQNLTKTLPPIENTDILFKKKGYVVNIKEYLEVEQQKNLNVNILHILFHMIETKINYQKSNNKVQIFTTDIYSKLLMRQLSYLIIKKIARDYQMLSKYKFALFPAFQINSFDQAFLGIVNFQKNSIEQVLLYQNNNETNKNQQQQADPVLMNLRLLFEGEKELISKKEGGWSLVNKDYSSKVDYEKINNSNLKLLLFVVFLTNSKSTFLELTEEQMFQEISSLLKRQQQITNNNFTYSNFPF